MVSSGAVVRAERRPNETWAAQRHSSPGLDRQIRRNPRSYLFAGLHSRETHSAVDFAAPETTNLDVRERHNQIWQNLSGLVKPGTRRKAA